MTGRIITSVVICPQKYYCAGGVPIAPFDPAQPSWLSPVDPTIKACPGGLWTEGVGARVLEQCCEYQQLWGVTGGLDTRVVLARLHPDQLPATATGIGSSAYGCCRSASMCQPVCVLQAGAAHSSCLLHFDCSSPCCCRRCSCPAQWSLLATRLPATPWSLVVTTSGGRTGRRQQRRQAATAVVRVCRW